MVFGFRLRHALSIILILLPACASAPESTEHDARGAEPLSVCAAGATVSGFDISSWQGTIDWSRAAKTGAGFAIARVSDGLDYPDSKFAANWSGMKAAGLIRGAYQYFRPAQDPIAEADLFLAAIAKDPIGAGDFPAILDVETVDGVPSATLQARMHQWLDHVEQNTGKKPIVYTASFMASTIGLGFSAYPLWVANYGATCPLMPAGWSGWLMWQYDDSGIVDGVPGGVDDNVFNGSLAALKAFVGQAPEPLPIPGIQWSCGASAYAGQQFWTCNDGNLFECQSGAAVTEACAHGCVSRPAGKNDLCISDAAGWSCGASAYAGQQLWTCSGGSIYRCANGAPEKVVCPSGCKANAIGTDDICN